MERWNGKVALVTGASSGIGAAVAEELVRNGLMVIGMARRVEKMEQLNQQLEGYKGTFIPYKGDVSKQEDVDDVFKFIQEKFGKIHVLVNNAGIGRNGLISYGKMQDFRDIVNVNLLGLVACTQKAIQLMDATGVDDGHIINMNSVVGHSVPVTPLPMWNIYSATKFGVTGFTETLRHELRHRKSKIRVTSISPGQVETEIGSATGSEETKRSIPKLKLLHWLADLPKLFPKDIADAVVYVLQTPPHVQIHELTIKPVGETV